MFDFVPHSRDTPPHGRDALTRAYARMLNFELCVVGSLGRGGISEAASMSEQSWMLSAGVLGETALPRFCGSSDRCFNRRITDDPP